MLDGAEGLNSVVASLAAQGIAVLDAVRSGLKTTTSTDTPDGAPGPNGTRQLGATQTREGVGG